MVIYNVLYKRISSVYALDMRELLRGQEVLTFGFDDFNKQMSMILVQAKDLYLYLIDYQ